MMCLLQFGTQNQLLPTTFDSRVYTKQEINDDNNIQHRNSSLSSITSNTSDIDGNNYASISVPYFLSATPRGSNNDNDNFDDLSQLFDADNQDSNVLAIDIRITFTIKVFFDLVKDYGLSFIISSNLVLIRGDFISY